MQTQNNLDEIYRDERYEVRLNYQKVIKLIKM